MSRERILVVDDQEPIRYMAKRILGAQYDVVLAESAGTAVRVLRDEKHFDVVILDIRMPGGDGFEAMRLLREVQPDLSVIFMTGSVTDLDARLTRAIREDAFFFLTKPFHRDVLLALVERCMDTRRLEREKRERQHAVERELAAARRFQDAIVPSPDFHAGGVHVRVIYESKLELCGDFYDFGLSQSAVTLLLVDVTGKGAGAAMAGAMVKLAFHGAAAEKYSPMVVLERIVTCARHFPDGMSLTAFCARLHPGAKLLEYSSFAGHPPAYVLRASGAVDELSANAHVLEPADPHWHGEQRGLPFGLGDRLVAFTDGVVEAPGPGGAMFFEPGLEKICSELPPGGAEATAVALRERVRQFQRGRPPDDDLTILVAELARP